MTPYLRCLGRPFAMYFDPVVIGFLFGFTMALAYLIPYAGGLLPFFLAGLIYVFRKRDWYVRESLVAGFVFATTYEFFILSWAWDASIYLSSMVIHIPFVLAALLIFFTLTLISIVAGITFLPWAYVSWKYRFSPIIDLLVLGGVWVACEWLRIASLSLLSYGDGVLNPPYLSFGMIGYSLADYPRILSIASYGGIYALSLLLVILGGIFFYGFRAVREKKERVFVIGALVTTVALMCGLIFFGEAKHVPTTSIPVTLTSTYSFPKIPDYTENLKVAQATTSLVVLPEGSRQFYPLTKTQPHSLHTGSVVIDSFPFPQKQQETVTTPGAFAISSTSMTLIREKHALAPYGEFTPFAMTVLAKLAGFAKTLDQFTYQRHYSPGSYNGSFMYDGIRGSVIFCDEIAVPNIAKDIVSQTGSNIIIAIASTHWFPSGYMLHRETVRMAKVRAVEAGVPIARSAFGDPAFVVDASGNLLYEGPWGRSTVTTVQVPVKAQ